jgi:hypothetical protein
MEHNELTKYATERYLLEEMPDAERDRFEEHFFSCIECAAEVRAGARMMAAGREVVRELDAPVVPFKKKTSWQWFPQTAAASVIAASVGWFGAVSTMRPVASVVAATEIRATQAERATAEPAKTVPAGGQSILSFDIPPNDDAVSFVYTVRDASGKVWLTKTASLEEAANPVLLVLTALPRGKYEVVIEAVRKEGQRAPVPGISFNVG